MFLCVNDDICGVAVSLQQQAETKKRRLQKRTTRQLQVVYQAVCQSRSHPSANEVYWYARRTVPRISLGTVYHNLQRLTEEGKIGIFLLGGRTARYDPTTTDHAHFVCQQCEHIEDIVLEQHVLRSTLNFLIQSGYTIFTHNFVTYGLCPACKKARKQPYKNGHPFNRG